jgi:hypothetical protein
MAKIMSAYSAPFFPVRPSQGKSKLVQPSPTLFQKKKIVYYYDNAQPFKSTRLPALASWTAAAATPLPATCPKAAQPPCNVIQRRANRCKAPWRRGCFPSLSKPFQPFSQEKKIVYFLMPTQINLTRRLSCFPYVKQFGNLPDAHVVYC